MGRDIPALFAFIRLESLRERFVGIWGEAGWPSHSFGQVWDKPQEAKTGIGIPGIRMPWLQARGIYVAPAGHGDALPTKDGYPYSMLGVGMPGHRNVLATGGGDLRGNRRAWGCPDYRWKGSCHALVGCGDAGHRKAYAIVLHEGIFASRALGRRHVGGHRGRWLRGELPFLARTGLKSSRHRRS
jgi:hypothetical protein